MSEHRKILVIHSSSDLYGASRVAIETIRILKDNNHSVVFAVTSDGPLCQEISSLGCPVEIIPLATIRRKYLNLSGLFNRLRAFRRSWKEIKRIVAQHQIDTIFSNTTGLVIGAFFSRKYKLTHVWHVHEIILKPSWLLKFYGYMMGKYADRVIVVSDAVKEHWLKVNPGINIVRIYNGFNFQDYGPTNKSLRSELNVNEDTILIGMIARVHFWKGQEYFLKIASHLKSQFTKLKFVMVGDAYPGYEYLYDELSILKKELGLEDCVVDLGYRSDIPNILNGLDIFILPSILPDPLPTTVLEAMAAGKPVVATNHGGAVEMVVPGETGLMIPWDEASQAAEAIAPLVSNDTMRAELGTEGRRRVLEEFSIMKYEENLIALIQNLE